MLEQIDISKIEILDILSQSENGKVFRILYDKREVVMKIPFIGSNELILLKTFEKNRFDGFIYPLGFSKYHNRDAFFMEFANELLSEKIEAHSIDIGSFSSIAKSLDRFHSMGWIHRDIHPGNIYHIGSKWVLGDFGISLELPCENEKSHGLVRYSLSSSLNGRMETKFNDLYSFCLCMMTLQNGIQPWNNKPEYSLFSIKEKNEIPPEATLPQKELLKSIINESHSISAVNIIEVLSHDFLKV